MPFDESKSLPTPCQRLAKDTGNISLQKSGIIHRLTTVQAAQYLGSYKALELYDRQYGYLHTQSFDSNVRDLSAYCRRMGGTL